MNYDKRYRFYSSLNGGSQWYELKLKKQVDLSHKKEKGQSFYRPESGEWEFMRWQNPTFYSLLAGRMASPDLMEHEVLVKIEYWKDFDALTKVLFNGYVPLNGFALDIDQGICKMKPKKKDEYAWYDEKNDIQVDISEVAVNEVMDDVDESFGQHFHKLSDLINYILTFHETGLTFESTLFSNPINPVTGAANGYANLLIQANPYFLPELPEDWTPEISIKDLLDLLVTAFHCEWIIVGNVLKVEHSRYFRNGMSYSGTPAISVDLTDITKYKRKYQVLADTSGSSTANRFSYPVDGFPSKITYKWGMAFDFYAVALTYQNPLASKDNNIDIVITKFEADTGYPIFALDDLDNKHFFIAACDVNLVEPPPGIVFIFPRYKMLHSIIRDEYAILGGTTNMINGFLFFDRLLRELHLDDSYFLVGKISGYPQTFTSKKRIKQQEDIKFPHLEDFDPFDLIKTNFGNGEIATMKHNLDTGFIQVTLLFETPNTIGTIEPDPIPET